jgi:hypothetical protein
MDRVDNLTAVVKREVAEYATVSPNATAYYVEDSRQQIFAVISVPMRNPQKATVMVMARIVGNAVIIDSDKTDHPLFEALMQAGVPREQIVLAYAGEASAAA